MTRDQKIAKARELREQGLTFEAIGGRLGVSHTAVWGWLNPERARERAKLSNAKRGPAKRQWERDNRAECPECGQPMRMGSKGRSNQPSRCHECVRDAALSRTFRFISQREQGLLNYEIAAREGVTAAVVAAALCRARRDHGLEVPLSPYWSAAARKRGVA